MSFTSEVKKELTLLEVHPVHARAELAAFIRLNGTVGLKKNALDLSIQTENAGTARRIYSLIKKYFVVESEILVRRKLKLKKNNVYIIRLHQGAEEVLSSLGLVEDGKLHNRVPRWIFDDQQQMRSYLRGAFLATGSVNSPETSRYHLEIRSTYQEHNDDLLEIMNRFELNARALSRRNSYIVYLKESERISDFLAVIGASASVLKFEDTRIVRDMRNSVNRLVNCENANLNKTVDAATQQIINIELIDSVTGLEHLPEKLQEMAYLRLEQPEASMKELGEMMPSGPISKSGVNHRIRKLNDMADKLREKEVRN